jgi:putative endonuclease
MDPRHVLGAAGEDHAAQHFARLGFEVVARRHRTRFGELDLVVRDGGLLVFAEVNGGFALPAFGGTAAR